MKALISTIEPTYDYNGQYLGYRVAQVVADADEFPVADGLMWVDCADTVVQDEYYFDPNTNQVIAKPVQEITAVPPNKEELMAKLLEIQSQLENLA